MRTGQVAVAGQHYIHPTQFRARWLLAQHEGTAALDRRLGGRLHNMDRVPAGDFLISGRDTARRLRRSHPGPSRHGSLARQGKWAQFLLPPQRDLHGEVFSMVTRS